MSYQTGINQLDVFPRLFFCAQTHTEFLCRCKTWTLRRFGKHHKPLLLIVAFSKTFYGINYDQTVCWYMAT